MPVVARDFYFIQTGMGKGCFNLFCGLLMCCDIDEFYSKIMAFCMIISGITFIFLSRCRHMSDEQLNRATSIATKELKKKAQTDALNYAKNHKDDIKQAAYDNREVIAQVAYDNKEAIAKAAVDNQELLAETYIKS